MTGQVALSEIRSILRLTQAQLATLSGISERTIRRIEHNLHKPYPITQRFLWEAAARLLPPESKVKIRTVTVNRITMVRYLDGRAPGWRHWRGSKRAAWRRWKNYYQRIQRDEQSGLCVIKDRFRPRDWTLELERRQSYQRWLAAHHYPPL